jgi:hypothetical protein
VASIPVEPAASVPVEPLNKPHDKARPLTCDLLQELSNVHEHYERYRLSLDQVDGHLVNRDLVPQLGQAVADFSNWQGKMVSLSESR